MEINKPITSVIILIVILILAFLFIIPKFQEFTRLQRFLIAREAEYEGSSIYYDKIPELISSFEDNEEALEKINSALPPDFSLSSIVYFFQEQASGSGLVIRSMTSLQGSRDTYSGRSSVQGAKKEIREVSFNINLTGSYQSLKNFLHSLENSARLFEVNSVNLSSSGSLNGAETANGAGTYNFGLSLTTHTY